MSNVLLRAEMEKAFYERLVPRAIEDEERKRRGIAAWFSPY